MKSSEELEYMPPTVSDMEEVTVRSLFPADLRLVSPLSGKEYRFPRAGSEVKVAIEDANWLLSLRRKNPCCGGTASGNLFELA